ncbi:MAG: riboflavin biosynthesis protein RibF [Prevotella sp.]|nr:riboflavin biosynthesis protein RibF [Prevotella sp.]MDY5666262.1 riboflavin biosynthesis protein RibF [Alloprevotella sp.]
MANFTLHTFKRSLNTEQGFCAAIGFFDGVHRGHCYLIDQVKAEAAKRGLLPIVISFEEHPRLAISGSRYWPELLTTNEQKLQLLARTGLAGCAMLHFTHDMSMLTSREFMQLILQKELDVHCLLIGYDHHFGSDLSAGFKDYVRYGRELGIEVLRERPFVADGELQISSSATRRFLTGGNVEMARACLGHPYVLEGTVVEGHHAGTLMGFPTANMRPDCNEQIIPGRGVYAVKAEINGFSYMGMLNIGWRPTLDNGDEQTIETHLLDYEGGDLYGHHIKLNFYRRIRDEHRFTNIEELQKQLAIDADQVRTYFKGL